MRPGTRRAPRQNARGREGLALPLVLLLLLGLTSLSHGILLLALQDRAASRASRALLQARVLAEGGVREVVAELARDTLRAREGPARQGEVPGAAYAVDVRRMGREILWVEGSGAASLGPSGPLRASHRTARLLWSLAPLSRVEAFRAVIEHGGGFLPFSSLAVEGSAAGEAGERDAPRGCRDRRAELDSILPGGVLPAVARVPLEESLLLPRLGLLSLDTLLARIPLHADGALTPAPSQEEGRCLVEAPGSWGSPRDPGGPCGGHRPAVAVLRDLRLEGGEGQGLLVVAGDLVLGEGSFYAGIVLVGGNLTLGRGATLEGLAQVRGRVELAEGARVRGRACPALLALEAAATLRPPIPLPGSGWLGPL